jgi:hypothetical protein
VNGGDAQPEGQADAGPSADGEQGIFLTLNGTPLKATLAGQPGSPSDVGYVDDASFDDAYPRVIVHATEGPGIDAWEIWLPKQPGVYPCGGNNDNDKVYIAIPVGPNGRSAANSAIRAENCEVHLTRIDRDGLIEATFAGVLGGTAGSPQTVTDGRIHIDNQRGGGDCSAAADPGLAGDATGATLSVTRVGPGLKGMPKYLRCGANLTLPLTASAAEPQGQRAFFDNPTAFWNQVPATLQVNGIQATVGMPGTCSLMFFNGFGLNDADDHCTVNVTRSDDMFVEGTYDATLSVNKGDGRTDVDITGHFRMPPNYQAPGN